MFLKKACFVVLLVLLAQIIVMKKLDRNKNKKKPTTSYRAYARKYTKASSATSTQRYHPKFQARAMATEALSKLNLESKTVSASSITSTQTSKLKTEKKIESSPSIKPIVESKSTSKQSSTEKSKTVTKKQPKSTNSSKTTTHKSSESKSITTKSSNKPLPSTVSTSLTSSAIPKSSSSTVSASKTTSSTSSAQQSTNQKDNINTSTILSDQIIEEIVTITVETDKEELSKSCYKKGKVDFTQYWIPIENQWDEDNHGERVYLGENEKVDLLDKDGNSLAIVPISMHKKCKMEGTCLLENGDMINIDNTTNSFIRIGAQGRENNVFGLGSGSQNLVPFISVASNDLPYGQKLYIKQLDGVDLGKGRIHNGCVRVDDDSWSFKGCQIDLFVLTYLDYLWLDLDLDRVNVEFDNCELKNYILREDLGSVKATNKVELIPSFLEAKYVKYTE